MAGYVIAVVSSRRPGNVPAMEAHCAGLPHRWYVAADEAGDYRYCGATDVTEVPGGLAAARNRALDDADELGVASVQLSDDLRRIGLAHGQTAAEVEPIGLERAIGLLVEAAASVDAQLAGGAPTANAFFSRQRINPYGFVVGDLTWQAPGCPLRYRIDLKEDYDLTLQHLAAYGRVARVDYLLPVFLHRTNRGGAVDTRRADPEAEAAAADWLLATWPAHLRRNTGRKGHELLLRWRPSDPMPVARVP